MDSLRRFSDAVQAFAQALGEVSFAALGIAIAFHLTNLTLRTRAWRNILAAAHPGTKVRWRHVFGAYCSGVAVNAIVPARGGDVVKLFLVHQRVQGATYPTLASSLLAETTFDAVVGLCLLTWAFQAGALPSLPSLPSLPAFEISFIAEHPLASAIVLAILIGLVAALMIMLGARIRAFWARVAQGLVILRTPKRYLRSVVSYQALGWCCRVAAAYFFLRAFHVSATLHNALLVLVIGSVATALPLTPGGVGPKQALAVVVLAGEAARSDILAFSVGMELAILVTNVLLGAACLGVMLKGFRFRKAMRQAKADRAAAVDGTGLGP